MHSKKVIRKHCCIIFSMAVFLYFLDADPLARIIANKWEYGQLQTFH